MQTTKCPLCNSDVIVDDEAVEGDLITCSNCESELEILSLSPLLVAALNDEDGSVGETDEEGGDQVGFEPDTTEDGIEESENFENGSGDD